MEQNKKNEKPVETIDKDVAALDGVLKSLFGDQAPIIVCVDDDSGHETHELVDAEDALKWLRHKAQKVQIEELFHAPSGTTPSHEDNSEMSFSELMADLISFAGFVERLDLMLDAVVYGGMCPCFALDSATEMVNTVFNVTEKWAKRLGSEL